MGHFTHNCKLTGLPIKDSAVLIVMKPSGNLYDNSEESLKKYGSTYMCSNDNTRMKFNPVWYPIKGHYNEYGGLEDIVETENTKILEEYYGLPIQTIMDIITSGRKDDGYDESLLAIKEPFVYPSDWVKGEKHFQYYQRTQNDPAPFGGSYPQERNGQHKIFIDGKEVKLTKEEHDAHYKLIHEQYARYTEWSKLNPDPEGDYGNPQYKERYKELVTYSGMWVHGKVYEEIANIKELNAYDKLDLGNRQLLEALGFEYTGKGKDPRYNLKFVKDGLTLYSDGTWIKSDGIYTLKGLEEYCEKNGVKIEVDEINSWSRVEQTCRLVMPTVNVPLDTHDYQSMLETLRKELPDNEFKIESKDILRQIFAGLSQEDMYVFYYLLNGKYSTNTIKNQLTPKYLKAVKEGKMIDEIAAFWKFNDYMYSMGAYYEIVGTGPQDGDFKAVRNVLQIALEIANEYVAEYEYEDED